GEDRRGALERLQNALQACDITGVSTNLELLRAISVHPQFAAGAVHTGFIAEHPEVIASVSRSDAHASARRGPTNDPAPQSASAGSAPNSPWDSGDGWRLNLPPAARVESQHAAATASGNSGRDRTVSNDDRVVSPMPGQLLQISVKPGDCVKRGQAL